MSSTFTSAQWDKIKTDSDLWWARELGRPLIQFRLAGAPTTAKKPAHPFYEFTSFYDMSVTPEQVVDAWEYSLLTTEHLGDAYPSVRPNFGPGSIGAYMGAKLENGNDTVWFHPSKEEDLNELELNYIPDEKWFLRTKDIIKAACDRWNGSVEIGLTDLGGNMDILSIFRPSEKLMFDLFDNPEKVEELNWRAHELWWKYFDEFNAMMPMNPGYSSWANIFSTKPHYILQCDFCFMISPNMFERFVKPELVATSQKLENVFYHLDGPGELAHLDSLLEVDSIHGIQWVPGAGQPDITGWPEVYKKITDAGKLIHIHSNMADDPFTAIDVLADQTGRADNIVYCFDGDISQKDDAIKLLEKYGC